MNAAAEGSLGFKDGVLAAWANGLAAISAEIDQVVRHLYSELLSEYWPPERRMVEAPCATIAFPFRELRRRISP